MIIFTANVRGYTATSNKSEGDALGTALITATLAGDAYELLPSDFSVATLSTDPLDYLTVLQ